MRKISLAVFMVLLTLNGASVSANPGMDAGGMINMINSPMGIGGNQVHDMKMIDDMKFRYREYNDYKDVQENKQEKAAKEFKLTEPAMQKIYNSRPQQQNVQFVEQNGEIKIQSIQ